MYIHSKLMIVDDVFTTHGSANINTRSMQVDSELNIAHEWASVTQAMRRRLWDLHTGGKGAQDDAETAFKAWQDIINEQQRSAERQGKRVLRPARRILLRRSQTEGPRLMRRFLLLSCLLLVACDIRSAYTSTKKDPHVNPLTEIKAKLAFTCAHEQIPESSTESDVLFQYARWLQKNNQLKQDKNVDVEIERLYRIAAENGHYKANINLQNGAMRGHFQLRGDEHLRLSQQLIDAGVATGYYFVGIFLQTGRCRTEAGPGNGVALLPQGRRSRQCPSPDTRWATSWRRAILRQT